MPTPSERLRDKLTRELAQSEIDAALHTRREATRLGDIPPAHALLQIAAHADQTNPHLASLVEGRQPVGVRLGRFVGRCFSRLRHEISDRIMDSERSYRATLLGLKHGHDVARLLRDVCDHTGDAELHQLCEQLVIERGALIERAEAALRWFARHPELALQPETRFAAELPSGTA
jgi:hypothetical protein